MHTLLVLIDRAYLNHLGLKVQLQDLQHRTLLTLEWSKGLLIVIRTARETARLFILEARKTMTEQHENEEEWVEARERENSAKQ